jgi:hypothetical protein
MHEGPYPATRSKTMSAKALARALVRAEKHGITAEAVRTKAAGLSGRQKVNMNRKPGTLKKSIVIGNNREKSARDMRNDKNFVVLSVGIMRRAFYGYWVEHGFIHAGKKKTHVPARPFLRPAFDSQVQALIERFRQALSEFIGSMGRA